MADVMTYQAAADELNRSVGWVKARIEDGTIKTVEHGGRTWVDQASVDRLAGQSQGRTVTATADEPSLGQILRALAVARARDDVSLPEPIARAFDGTQVQTGGGMVAPQIADRFWAKVRSTEPLSRLQWTTMNARELQIPVSGEVSRAIGSRLGGVVARVGATQIASPDLSAFTLSQPSVGMANLIAHDIVVYGPRCSLDLLKDATPALIQYIELSQLEEVCFTLIDIMLGTVYNIPGIVSQSSTIQVTRNGGNAVALSDLDAMFARLYAPCKRSAVWMMADDTLDKLSSLATTEQWPIQIFTPVNIYGNATPFLKGRPVLAVENCPALGSLGDVMLIDPTQFVCGVHQPQTPSTAVQSGLMLAALESYEAARMINQALERRRSDERYWDSDQSVFLAKFRADIRCLWPSALTPANGSTNTLSCSVILK